MNITRKTIIPLFFIMILASCNSFSSSSPTMSPTDATERTETQSPTIINTAVPTDTPIPTRAPTTVTTTVEPIPFTYYRVVMTALSKTGENIYSYPDGPFRVFAVYANGLEVLPSDIELFRFSIDITASRFTKNEHTPTPTAMPTSGWQLLIYRYRTDETYTNQIANKVNLTTVDKTNNDIMEIVSSADIMMKDLQTKFGDCSAFTFQVIDGQERVQQQGYFSINSSSGAYIKGNFQDSLTTGYPYSISENKTEFFHQGKFVTIYEPKSGFYRLAYLFNFVNASGVSATIEQEEVASKLSIKIFPYREDGKYSIYDSHPAIGILYSGVGLFNVDLPIDYLRENINGKNKFYLQIMDDKGKIIWDEYFLFIPYTP